MDIWDLAIITLISCNLFIGIGSLFSTEIMESFGYNNSFSNASYYTINESAYNESMESTELNPSLSNIQSALHIVRDVFFGIPAITKDVMDVAGAPEELKTRVYSALFIIVLAIYAIGIIKLIFNAGS